MSDDRPDGLDAELRVRRGEFVLAVNLQVPAGRVLAVLGPNGAGKTTLLRSLAGLDAIDTGRIALAGRTLDAPADRRFVPAEERHIGVVFQDYRLFPHLSVADNVAFGLRRRGLSRDAARRDALHWLDLLGVGDFARRRPSQLSGGQAQRVALARALAPGPDLLLLDEPMAALDVETRQQVRGELRRHLGEFAGPTLLVTHDPLEAMVLADELAVLEAGRLAQRGTPAEIARRPATPYIARLLGLNLYAGVIATEGLITLDTGGTLIASAGPVAGAVLATVRPSAITVHLHEPVSESSRNRWPGRITGLEMLADRVRLQVDAVPAALVDITPAAMAELGLTDGTGVWLSAKATEIEVYPRP